MYCIKYLLIVGVAILSTTTAAVVQSSQHLSTYRSVKAHRVIATWDQAQNICASEGGIVASPVNEELLSDIQHLITSNSRDNSHKYFIGARARQVHGQYVSIEGVALEDMPVFDMLERLDPTEGDCLSIDEDTISVVSCWMPLPYICHFNKTTTNYTITDNTTLNEPVLNSTKKLGCPTEGFIPIESSGKCYKYFTESKPWWEAKVACADQGAQLLVLKDDNEARHLVEQIYNIHYTGVWTGLRDMSGRGDWRSIIDGTPVEQLYNQWNYGTKRTNSGLVDLTCGYFTSAFRNLDSRNCKFGIHYMCEQPIE